ncbi:MAG: dUTP diphosphatase [Chloroflexus sp.]|nr:dUTP diphosphatase [Chloroflexus sp.]
MLTVISSVWDADLHYRSPRIGDAGLDLIAAHDVLINPNQSAAVRTGLRVAIPSGFVGLVRGRSGLAFKHRVFAFEGTIDSSYRGEIAVLLINLSDVPFAAHRGMRIAQLVVVPCAQIDLSQAEALDETERGDQGFGSTGL